MKNLNMHGIVFFREGGRERRERERCRERDECNLSEGFALKNGAVELVLHG